MSGCSLEGSSRRVGDGELSPVMFEVLRGVVVDVRKAHVVGEVRIPSRGESHGPPQRLVGLSIEMALQ